MRPLNLAVALIASAILAACGGSDDSSARGGLNSLAAVTKLSASSISANAQASGLIAASGEAKCDVTVYSMDYQTVGVKNEETNSTGVLLLPSGTGCPAGPYPLLAYARGTEVLKSRTLANPSDPETFLLTAIYAAQGYAVVATDYLGYAGSKYPYHPYLHADSEATSVIDSMRAARLVASSAGVPLSGKVMVAGYSQGGHSSMAAQRAIERDYAGEFNLVGGGHMSGPYNLSGSIISGATTPIAGGQYFVPFFITAWQKAYGDVYGKTTDVFLDPYAASIESLLPGAYSFTGLLQNGLLPADANYLPKLFQPAYLNDLATNPNSTTVRAAKRNDLLGWNPKAKMMLCGGAQDPTVIFPLHTKVAQADFSSRNINVPVVDVDPIIQATATKAQQPVNLAIYHGTLVPPLCMSALRDQFFNSLR